MRDFQKSKIYKLYSVNNPNLVYFGSTTQRLSQRLAEHVKSYKIGSNIASRSILETGNYNIELIEEYPCNDNKELLEKESEYIRNNECLNKVIPNRNRAEWYETNRPQLLMKRNIRYLKEKEDLQKKVTCSCGCEIKKFSLNKHLKSNKHNNIINNI